MVLRSNLFVAGWLLLLVLTTDGSLLVFRILKIVDFEDDGGFLLLNSTEFSLGNCADKSS